MALFLISQFVTGGVILCNEQALLKTAPQPLKYDIEQLDAHDRDYFVEVKNTHSGGGDGHVQYFVQLLSMI